MSNPFFNNHGPFKISDILQTLNLKSDKTYSNLNVNDIKDLITSNKNDITFFHSKKYK
jgi:UDP-3-O-[3-hydroxymyristoyl] glucosamine N-acyltransferase